MTQETGLTRRSALAMAGMAAGGLIISSRVAHAEAAWTGSSHPLPVRQMENILQVDASVSDGVASFEFDRDDLHAHLPGNIPVLPAAELNGTVYFQRVGHHGAIVNGDFCLKPSETNPFIEALIDNGLVVQAFHQHLFDLNPLLWFIHFRGIGDPLELARSLHRAIKVTSTPLPQHTPSNPPTPFHVHALEKILGGSAEVGSDGVVEVTIPRAEDIILAGVHIKPELGVAHTVVFQPLTAHGERALVVPDFALRSREVNPVFKRMRAEGFVNGCLYNQETAEEPQLYFSHQWAAGDPYELARKVRRGLNLTNADFQSS